MSAIVDDEMLHEYSKAVVEIIATHLHRPYPSELWHYTTGDALIKILRSGTLWSTQVSCVNDALEFKHAVSLTQSAFKRRHDSDGNLTSDQKSLINEIQLALVQDGRETANYFVTCFSERRDDVSQWRAYGTGEGGYSIRFNIDALSGQSRMIGYLAPVTYDRAVQDRVADAVVSQTLRLYDAGLSKRPGITLGVWTAAFLEAWREAVAYIAPLIKHEAFEAEKEWRLIKRLVVDDVPNMEYLQRQSMLSRHLPLVFMPPKGATWRRLPIEEIMVGPSRHKGPSRVTVGDILLTYGYAAADIRRTESNAPYQAF